MGYSKKKDRCGIYKITNTVNNKIYIGSSNDILERWNQHKKSLRRNKHHNVYLQRSWNKNGESFFKHELIEYCAIDVLLEREQYFLDLYDASNPKIGYNFYDVVKGGAHCRKVAKYDKNGKFIEEYKSLALAADTNDIKSSSGIYGACKAPGKIKSGRWYWKYIDDDLYKNDIEIIHKPKSYVHVFDLLNNHLGKFSTNIAVGYFLNIDAGEISKYLNNKLRSGKYIFIKTDSEDVPMLAYYDRLKEFTDRSDDILETRRTNIEQAVKNSAKNRQRSVDMLKDNKIIMTFDSIKLAADYINRIPSTVLSVLQGKTKTAGGYVWKYH